MNRVRDFEEFIHEGIVKKQTSNKPRAEFLIKESERSHNFLLKIIQMIGVNNENANDIIKNCYDILMELVRAKMLIEGYNAAGFGAHEAEVSYMRILKFKESDIQFADQMRYFRNGMIYYGTILDKEYAEKVISFTRRVYESLKKILNTR